MNADTLAVPRLYPGAVIVFWGPKWSHMPKRALEPAIVITLFNDGTFSSLGLDETGTHPRAHAKVADYSLEPKTGYWCWPGVVT